MKFQAWSQNIGHERVLTTLTSNDKVSASRQAELIRGLGQQPINSQDEAAVLTGMFADFVRQRGGMA